VLRERIDPQVSENLVLKALIQLQQAELLERSVTPAAAQAEASRRAFLHGAGAIGAAVSLAPAIVSIAVPSPAEAQTRIGVEGDIGGQFPTDHPQERTP
jgi:hypothetical protein